MSPFSPYSGSVSSNKHEPVKVSLENKGPQVSFDPPHSISVSNPTLTLKSSPFQHSFRDQNRFYPKRFQHNELSGKLCICYERARCASMWCNQINNSDLNCMFSISPYQRSDCFWCWRLWRLEWLHVNLGVVAGLDCIFISFIRSRAGRERRPTVIYTVSASILLSLYYATTIRQTVRVEGCWDSVDVKGLSRLLLSQWPSHPKQTVQGTCLMFYRCYYTACSH